MFEFKGKTVKITISNDLGIRFSNERELHTIHVSNFTYLVWMDSPYFGKMPQNSLWTFEALVVSFEHGITDRMRKLESLEKRSKHSTMSSCAPFVLGKTSFDSHYNVHNTNISRIVALLYMLHTVNIEI